MRTYPEQDAPQEKTGVGEDEILIVSSWSEAVNLGELAWEALITALPPAVFCLEECRGLCPQCGANLNKTVCGCKKETGDPRFEALKDLLDDEA